MSVTLGPSNITFNDSTTVASGAQLAKAWANFASAGTINGSYNVSSITRNSVGYYTVNFTNAMADANYSFANYGTNGWGNQYSTKTTTQLGITFTVYNVSNFDQNPGSIIIFD